MCDVLSMSFILDAKLEKSGKVVVSGMDNHYLLLHVFGWERFLLGVVHIISSVS